MTLALGMSDCRCKSRFGKECRTPLEGSLYSSLVGFAPAEVQASMMLLEAFRAVSWLTSLGPAVRLGRKSDSLARRFILW